MADGSHKAIKDIRPRDRVVATDPASGQTVAKEVTDTIFGAGTKELVQISVRLENGSGTAETSIVATAGHPFWVPALRQWVDATYLQPGKRLRTSAGTWVKVTGVKRWTAAQQVYNLTVADVHTYYVGVGGVSVLVHNAERIPPFVTEMLRAIKDGSLGQRTNLDGSLDFYRYREPNRRTGLGGGSA